MEHFRRFQSRHEVYLRSKARCRSGRDALALRKSTVKVRNVKIASGGNIRKLLKSNIVIERSQEGEGGSYILL